MRIHDILLSEELAIHEPALAVILARLSPFYHRLAGGEGDRLVMDRVNAESELTIADFINQRRPYEMTADGFAIIHANDVLGRGLTNIDRILGATDYNQLIEEFAQATADGAVRGILFDVNSPGGSVLGLQEARDAVSEAAAQKPVVAFIEQMGASAAYGLAVAAQAIVASSSAVVGSIGTISTYRNLSGLLAQVGIRIEHLTGGDLKAAGTGFRDMTRDERDFLQGRVDAFSAAFRNWVQQHRPSVEAYSMRGQWFTGAEALTRGLVDGLGSRNQALDALRALASL